MNWGRVVTANCIRIVFQKLKLLEIEIEIEMDYEYRRQWVMVLCRCDYFSMNILNSMNKLSVRYQSYSDQDQDQDHFNCNYVILILRNVNGMNEIMEKYDKQITRQLQAPTHSYRWFNF